MVGVASEFLVDDAKELLAGVNADFGVDVADVTVGGTGEINSASEMNGSLRPFMSSPITSVSRVVRP